MLGFFNRKTITVWIGINKNGALSMHTVEPIRDEELGIWVSESPFVNSVLYSNLSKMIEKTPMNWESEAQPFQINV